MDRYIYMPEDGEVLVDVASGYYVYQLRESVERTVVQRALGCGRGDKIPPRALKPLVVAGLVYTGNPETDWNDLESKVAFEGTLPDAAYEAVAERLAGAKLSESQSERLHALLDGTRFLDHLDEDDLAPFSGTTEQDLSNANEDTRGRSSVQHGDRAGSRNDLLNGI